MIKYLHIADAPNPSGTRNGGQTTYWKVPIDIKLTTSGTGLWSKEIKTVNHHSIEINGFMDWDTNSQVEFFRFYEMRVGFKRGWNIDRHGLVYTDPGWIKALKTELMKIGFTNYSLSGISYSEQGMQGKDYVSLDIDNKFARKLFQVFHNGN